MFLVAPRVVRPGNCVVAAAANRVGLMKSSRNFLRPHSVPVAMGRKTRIGQWKRRHFLLSVVCAVLASALAFGGSDAVARNSLQAQPHITEWTVPELGSHPEQIVAAGSGDSAWFTNNVQRGRINSGNRVHYAQVDRIDGSGTFTPFSVGGGLGLVLDVARGPGGTSFVGEGYVGRIPPGRQVQEFLVRTGSFDSLSLAFGAGGYLWLTRRAEGGHDAIQRISRHDTVTAFPLPHRYSGPRAITRGTDGAMWFTEYFGNRIGRISSVGKITEYPLKARAYGEALPVTPVGEIAAGAHGYLWFGTFGAIGRLSPSSGKVTLFYRREVSEPLVAGPDGSIWFVENDKIGRIAPGGRFSKMIRLPRGTGRVRGLTVGADGSIWFTAERPSAVGRITFGGSASAASGRS